MFPKHLSILVTTIILHIEFVICSYAQIPEIEWEHSFGGTGAEESYDIVKTPDSNLLIVGYASPLLGDFVDCGEYGGFVAVKVTPEGEILWSRCYGGSEGGVAQAVCNTSDGGFIIAGYSYSEDGDVIGTHGSNSDCWVVKLNSIGEMEWNRAYGGSAFDSGEDILQTSDGNYLVFCRSSSFDGDVTDHHGISSNTDYWVLKLNEFGDIIWANSYGGDEDDDCRSGTLDSFGNIIVVGTSASGNGDVPAISGYSDIWVIKLNESGEILWSKTYGGSNSEQGWGCVCLQDNYYVIGHTYSNDLDVTGSHGGIDAWFLKIDSIGELVSQTCLGGLRADNLAKISITQDSSLLLSGHSGSSDGDLTEHHGSYLYADLWIVNADTNGVINWQKSVGGSLRDEAWSAVQLTEDSYIATGLTKSNDGDVTDLSGLSDFWTVKFKVCNTTYYIDLDGDGFGDNAIDSIACIPPLGFVTDSTDCNDTNPDIHPLLSDICNSVDDNCNGLTDEDATFITYYIDADGDTYGDPLIDSISCSTVIGFVENDLDCNDADAAINPDVLELCNSIDDNCNTIIDEGLTIYTFYLDADGDTYGDPTSVIDTCSETVTGYVANNFDCNDSNASIYPGAEEICNYLDDDCDGVADDNLAHTWQYQDADGDNYGNVAIDTLACLEIPGYITDSTDCNDLNPNIYPGAPEILNGLDDDCDGLSDEGLSIINNQVIQLAIHPIPATDHIIIDYPTSTPTTLNIYTSSGAIIYQNPHWTGEAIDISNFPPAMYYLQLLQPEKVGYGCFVKG